MKNILKTLTIIGFLNVILFSFGCENSGQPKQHSNPTVSVDTTKYTDVVLINNSEFDSIQVFITLQSTETIVGKFGMDSTNFNPDAKLPSGKPVPCKGIFWAKKGVSYHLGDSSALQSVVVCWGIDNQACSAAQSILGPDKKQLYPFGLNIFEFTVNTWWQNGKTTGSNESFDISCVDGLHSVLKQSVTSFGPRNNVGLNPNFSAFWDYGYVNKSGKLEMFSKSMNGINFKGCVNIAGVYPYGCDLGYRKQKPPTPCSDPSYPVECSTKWGWGVNASQLNRQGQGGRITCEFLGFTKDAVPL